MRVAESSEMVNRRTFVASGLGAGLAAGFSSLTSCGRHERATGFSGYAFIANQEGGAIAAVDLEVFAVARHIRVNGSPTAVLADSRTARVYALTPENGSVHEIRTDNLTFARRLQVAGTALEMRLSPAGDALYVLCQRPKQLVRLTLNPMQVAWTLPLPDEPADFDISPNGRTAAISSGSGCSITFVDVANRRSFSPLRTSGEIGLVRFQPFHLADRAESDSQQLIAANVSQRMLSIFDVPRRRLIVNLPLAVRPDH